MSMWSSQYRDVRWQKKRLEIMERDSFTCQSCGKKENVTLNVHHAYYEKGMKPWEYDDIMLVTLCEECHTQKHTYQKEILLALSRMHPGKMVVAQYMISTFLYTTEMLFSAIMDSGIDPHSIQAMLDTLVEVKNLAREEFESEQEENQ